METYLKLKPSGCKDCYKCIRNCPVKAIRFSENQAQIIEDECILCGRCYVVCPQNAKEVRADAAAVKTAIRAGKRVVAGIAPSFIAAFDVGGIEDMRQGLTKLGFADVQETAIGAEFVSREYEKMLADGQHRVLIS
ncbi:MAG: 4Fe-4S binding protein, partial [Eubacteriales bacterium]|nr:4Fe-4S binding protein [Eubacteriales bacterium]